MGNHKMDRISTEVNTHESAQPVYTVKYLEELVTRVRNGKLKIAIYGLGHVGAPLAAVWLRAGAHVIGVDKSKKVLAEARRGRTTIPEPHVNEAFKRGIVSRRFELYDDPIKA